MLLTKNGYPVRGHGASSGRGGKVKPRQPAALALALSLKQSLLEILERRKDCLDRDPRETEFLQDVRRSLAASRLLNKKKIPLRVWQATERQIRDRWIRTPINAPLKICLGCAFACGTCQRADCNCGKKG